MHELIPFAKAWLDERTGCEKDLRPRKTATIPGG